MSNRSRILRLSRYKNAALRLKSLNFLKVFSDNLADATGVTASQVRKDFSIFSISGNRRGGYQIEELLTQLNRVLGKDKLQKFILVGVGNLGRALINYQGFAKSEIKIVAGFDTDPAKFNRKADTLILPMDELAGFIKTNEVELAILTVPEFNAQEAFDKLKAAGIKGILNFAPTRLKSDDKVIVHNLNLETEFENLIYFVNTKTLPSD
ncbi:MAG: redox-sensing transcriptional repressor Rex [Kiritimatiellales bacterium]